MNRNSIPYTLMFLSGAAALGYEMVWVRALSAGLGHEIVSVLAVMAAFFVGTAAGAWLLAPPIKQSSAPWRWYAALESVIALWAVVLSFLIPKSAFWGAVLAGIQPPALLQWSVTFFLPLVLLLPATMAMGATLPAMDSIVVRVNQKEHMLGGLYAANTLGAVTGTLTVTFWLAPAVGFNLTQYLLAVVNVVCTLGALTRSNRSDSVGKVAVWKSRAESPVKFLFPVMFFTGLLGIGYEVVTVRVLSQVLENTVFSYAVLLSVYLSGTASGAFFYQRHLVQRDRDRVLHGLLAAQALTCIAGIWMLGISGAVYAFVEKNSSTRIAEMVVAATAFILPTLVMGAVFSHLAQAAKDQCNGLGKALAVNTMGGAFAPFLFGILLVPLWGAVGTLLVISLGYMVLLFLSTRRIPILPTIGCGAAAGLIFIVSGSFDFNRLHDGEKVIIHLPGVMAGVTVVQDDHQQRHLKVNNHYRMGGTASRYSDSRQAYIPLLIHPDPEKVLFLGLGTGTTFASAGCFQNLKIDGVELIPEVVWLMPYFQSPQDEAANGENRHIYIADARRFVLAQKQFYDVIIADLFHPSRDGAGYLYTREHFGAVRRRLSEDGIFCQWLPLYQMDLDLFRLISRTFLDVFPQGAVFLAHHSLTQPIVGLIGGRQAIRIEPGNYDYRTAVQPVLAARLKSVGLTSMYTLVGCFLADGLQLHEFIGPGPLNTDDHPRVMFQAPDFVYTAPSSPPVAGDRLMALVQAFHPKSEDVLTSTATEDERSRLAAYWQARNAYLSVGTRMTPQADLKRTVEQVAKPLLDIVHTSRDFDAAYHPLLLMAGRLYPTDPGIAEEMLAALMEAAPQRPDASRLKWRLSQGAIPIESNRR